jgi:integrase
MNIFVILLFNSKKKKYHIDYHTINPVFFDLYKSYILTENGLGWNTFVTAIKKLKFFMNWSLDKHYHNEHGFKEFSATDKEPTIIFLTMAELTTLYNFDFKSQRLNQTRDKFCFGCFTSLAFADLDALTSEHINNGTLTKFRQKTKSPLDIELPDQALEIIKRYQRKYKALPKLSSGKMNEYIKECCEIAGINTPTIYKDFTGGITTEKIAPKWKLITIHDVRRTFITNFYNQTKDLRLTKQNAGITQDKTLRRYLGSNKQMERDAMKKAFGGMNKIQKSIEDELTDMNISIDELDKLFNQLES